MFKVNAFAGAEGEVITFGPFAGLTATFDEFRLFNSNGEEVLTFKYKQEQIIVPPYDEPWLAAWVHPDGRAFSDLCLEFEA